MKYLQGVYPNRVLGERLSLISEWRNATKSYSSEDIVLLQANDDHLLIPNSKKYLYEIEQTMIVDNSIKMSSITHFPEFRGLLHRENIDKPLMGNNFILVCNVIGTILVKAPFLQSWFDNQSFPRDIKLVRPDNPFGKSVSFPPSKMLIPDREIMRHMDGYSHALLYRPLPPIRNTKLFSDRSDRIIDLDSWKIGLWPMAQFGYRGRGVDFYRQQHDNVESLFTSLRIDVANQVSANALSINLGVSLTSINPRYRDSYSYKFILSVLLLSNINLLRNIPDLIFQKFHQNSSTKQSINQTTLTGRELLVNNLGFVRGMLIHFRQRFWWLMPNNLGLTYSILKRKVLKNLRR